jgi:hypothetical protein
LGDGPGGLTRSLPAAPTHSADELALRAGRPGPRRRVGGGPAGGQISPGALQDEAAAQRRQPGLSIVMLPALGGSGEPEVAFQAPQSKPPPTTPEPVPAIQPDAGRGMSRKARAQCGLADELWRLVEGGWCAGYPSARQAHPYSTFPGSSGNVLRSRFVTDLISDENRPT